MKQISLPSLHIKTGSAAIMALLLCLSPIKTKAQEHGHSHARNEIGISPGATYSPSHETWGFGIHAHYFRTLSEHSRWAIGGSIEQVSSHGSHWSLSVGPKYQILDRLSVAVMPGITFFKHDEGDHDHDAHTAGDSHDARRRFSLHTELVYDLIHLDRFHLGPTVDYSWSKNDSHFMIGVHCAYAF